MSESVILTAEDGHRLGAYLAAPVGTARSGLVVLQEFYGLNAHIREVCDRFAAEGYTVISPTLYHRIDDTQPHGPTIPYGDDSVPLGRELRARVGWENSVVDVRAAAMALSDYPNVGVVGYCWGGTLAWLASARVAIRCAVGYYGGQIDQFLDEAPGCPLMLQFGAADKYITQDRVDRIQAAVPNVPIHRYEDAGHGFNCDHSDEYRPAAARLAQARTLEFLAQHLD
jgi:carboxymethylenebutenolidase